MMSAPTELSEFLYLKDSKDDSSDDIHFNRDKTFLPNLQTQSSFSSYFLAGDDENLGVMLNIPDEEPSAKKISQKRKKISSEAYKKRNEILTDIENDLKNYYEDKLKIENKKLQLKKDSLKDRIKRTELLRDKWNSS
ncbi:hypothetical protein JTB14_011595 [Gonioctena quinquepunctata]|nr:hypothetical protein JTB14_011595 [Gonioctena quinquepunctata]